MLLFREGGGRAGLKEGPVRGRGRARTVSHTLQHQVTGRAAGLGASGREGGVFGAGKSKKRMRGALHDMDGAGMYPALSQPILHSRTPRPQLIPQCRPLQTPSPLLCPGPNSPPRRAPPLAAMKTLAKRPSPRLHLQRPPPPPSPIHHHTRPPPAPQLPLRPLHAGRAFQHSADDFTAERRPEGGGNLRRGECAVEGRICFLPRSPSKDQLVGGGAGRGEGGEGGRGEGGPHTVSRSHTSEDAVCARVSERRAVFCVAPRFPHSPAQVKEGGEGRGERALRPFTAFRAPSPAVPRGAAL